jgi:integrase
VGVPVLARIHNIRHSIATALKEAGVPENQAAALLGHDVDTYRRFYLVTDDEAAADGAEAAGKAFAI